MLLNLIKRVIQVEPLDLKSFTSKHTGNELVEFSFEMTVPEQRREEFDELLDRLKEEGFTETDQDNIVLRNLKVVNSSFSYSYQNSQRPTIYNYTLNAKEYEKLNIELLHLADCEVKPYKYDEEVDSDRGAIIITCDIVVTEEEDEKLRSLGQGEKYFTVLRKGISEKQLLMRYGKIIWSKHEQNIKKRLILVEKVYDDVNVGRMVDFTYPQLQNTMNMLSYTSTLLNNLIREIEDKELLNSELLGSIKEMSRQEAKESMYKFLLVEDVDKE